VKTVMKLEFGNKEHLD